MYTLTISTLNSNIIAMWTAGAGRGRMATAEDAVLLSITLNVVQQYDSCCLCPVQRGTSIAGYKWTSDTEIHITHTWWHNGRSYDKQNDSCWVIDSHIHTHTQAHRHRFTHTDTHTQRHPHIWLSAKRCANGGVRFLIVNKICFKYFVLLLLCVCVHNWSVSQWKQYEL